MAHLYHVRWIDTAEIRYPKDKEHLLVRAQKMAHEDPAGFGFHYDPYDFDSAPGRGFFVDLLKQINLRAAEVKDIYFTGALPIRRRPTSTSSTGALTVAGTATHPNS